MLWSQALCSLGFKNVRGLLQEVQSHMSYTVWRSHRKIINEARSLTKGDMYFGEWLPSEMAICVKSNWTGYQYTCQLKKKKEERLYFLNCLSSSTAFKIINEMVSKHLVQSTRALSLRLGVLVVCWNFRIKWRCLCWQYAWHLEGTYCLFLISKASLCINTVV